MIDWKKLGFHESKNWSGEKEYVRDDFPIHFQEENGFLTIYNVTSVDFFNHETEISSGTIPATTQAVRLILKAFKKAN